MSRKVVLANYSYYPDYGGVENSIYYLAEEYAALDDEVVIFAGVSSGSSTERKNLMVHENVREIRFHKFGSGALAPVRWIGTGMISLVRGLADLRQFQPDLIVSRNHFVFCLLDLFVPNQRHVYLAPGFCDFQLRPENLRSEFSLLGRILHHIKMKIHRRMEFRALYRSDAIFLFSNNMLQQCRTLYGNRFENKLAIVKPGVDVHRFYPDHLSSDMSRIRLLCVGRLVKAKGFHLAIEALSILPEKFVLTLVGDGPEEQPLKNFAHEIGVSNRVEFIGAVSTPENFYRQAHIFVMTSTYEPLGQTVLEAAASGLAVVSFVSGENGVQNATLEVLGDRATYVNEVDASKLAGTIERVAHAIESGESASQRTEQLAYVKKNLTWENLARQLAGL